MPIRPEPKTYVCPKCGWQKTTAPRSDALMPGDVYKKCPHCENQNLEVHYTAQSSGLFTQLFNLFKR